MDFYRPETNQDTLKALGDIFRAVRAWKFYPQGHPTRRNSLNLAYSSLQQLLAGNTLSLASGRTGFSFPDGGYLKDTSKQATTLAYELFVRRVQKITFLNDLTQEDLLELLKILCMSPEAVQQAGGVDTTMTARGVRTIWVNEFDLTTIHKQRQKVEQTGIVPQGIDESESDSDMTTVIEEQPPESGAQSPEQQLQALIERLTTSVDDDIYLRLVRHAVSCANDLTPLHSPHLLLPLIELLASHANDKGRSEAMREGAQFAIEQIITNSEVLHLVLERTEQDNGISKAALQSILRVGGASAISAAIELMGRTNSIKTRKTLSTMLGNLGETAVPVLVDLMRDSRWFIARNICAILGAIGSDEALPALTNALLHPDLRVKKEAIRSLTLLGGQEAETAIIDVLCGTDAALYPQAITSLGGMKSRKALLELMKIVFSRDLFLKLLSFKLDALAAIASIGDRQVTPHLIKILDERFLLAAARGKQLKTAVAVCLGKIGDTRALPALEKQISGSGEFAAACSEAVAMIEKAEG